MNAKLDLKDWQLNEGASESVIQQAVESTAHHLPSDYVDFLRQHDGGEGFLGDNYLILWRAAELSTFNDEYEVRQYAPGLLLFGSNGGGEGYGFDTRTEAMPVIKIPFIGMDLRYANVVAPSFSDLLKKLRQK